MFFRSKPPEVDLTGDAFDRWLRAQRPPWLWFLAQDAEVQESLALKGDDHAADLALAIGYAVKDPELAEAGMAAAEDPDAEVVLAQRIAADAIRRRLEGGSASAPVASAPLPDQPITLGGFGQRRAQLARERHKAKTEGATFLGRKPDPTEHDQTRPNATAGELHLDEEVTG